MRHGQAHSADGIVSASEINRMRSSIHKHLKRLSEQRKNTVVWIGGTAKPRAPRHRNRLLHDLCRVMDEQGVQDGPSFPDDPQL